MKEGHMADNSPEYELISKLLSTYDDLGEEDGVSSWVMFNNDFTQVSEHFNRICHAEMRQASPGYDTLITACPNSDELSIKYIEWLAVGPFRAYQDKISLEQVSPGLYIIRCSDLANWPANVLYNYCIATRVPIEFPKHLVSWKKMLDEGFDPSLAFALAPYRFQGLDEPIKSTGATKEHLWFDFSANTRNIIAGTFDWSHVSGHMFKDHPDECTPTNTIWGVLEPEDRAQMAGKTPRELCEFFGLPAKVEPAFDPDAAGKKWLEHLLAVEKATAMAMAAELAKAKAMEVKMAGINQQWKQLKINNVE